MFSYFNSIDATGHESKWGSEEQLKAVGDIDDKIAKIIDALREKDLLESTYILITSDHGASMGALNHM
jgi:predicted AlkP superfamily pyrophosphatase or phosphodiesterase